MYSLMLCLHVLAATLWTGGHLLLTLGFLPEALRKQDVQLIEQFEQRYEKVGVPALGIQVLSGLWLAHLRQPAWGRWYSFADANSSLIALKFILLGFTVGLALHARLRLIPNLGPTNLRPLAYHIVAVTLLAVLFVLVGVAFRTGGSF